MCDPEAPPVDSTVVSIARFATSYSYVIVDPILTYPPPANIRLDFSVKQQGAWNTPAWDLIQFGSGFLVPGWIVGWPQTAIRYFGTPGVRTWYNVTGGVLDYFDLLVPHP